MPVADRANSIHVLGCFWLGSLLSPLSYWMTLAVAQYAQAGHDDAAAFYALIILPGIALVYSGVASVGYGLGALLVPRIDAEHSVRLCALAAGLGVLCFAAWQLIGVNYLYNMGQSPVPLGFVGPLVAAPLIPLLLTPLLLHLAAHLGVLQKTP